MYREYNYRPGQALREPGVWGSQISRQTTHEGGTVVRPMHGLLCPPPLPLQEIFLVLISLRGWVDPRAGRIMLMKNSSDTIGNRTRAFRLVAQRLNQLRHRVPLVKNVNKDVFLDSKCLVIYMISNRNSTRLSMKFLDWNVWSNR
jgi:hypothetical protein